MKKRCCTTHLIFSLHLLPCTPFAFNGFKLRQLRFCSSHYFYLTVSKYVLPNTSRSLLKVITTAPANKFMIKKFPKISNIMKNSDQ